VQEFFIIERFEFFRDEPFIFCEIHNWTICPVCEAMIGCIRETIRAGVRKLELHLAIETWTILADGPFGDFKNTLEVTAVVAAQMWNWIWRDQKIEVGRGNQSVGFESNDHQDPFYN